jgi:hypothetical protein
VFCNQRNWGGDRLGGVLIFPKPFQGFVGRSAPAKEPLRPAAMAGGAARRGIVALVGAAAWIDGAPSKCLQDSFPTAHPAAKPSTRRPPCFALIGRSVGH